MAVRGSTDIHGGKGEAKWQGEKPVLSAGDWFHKAVIKSKSYINMNFTMYALYLVLSGEGQDIKNLY